MKKKKAKRRSIIPDVVIPAMPPNPATKPIKSKRKPRKVNPDDLPPPPVYA